MHQQPITRCGAGLLAALILLAGIQAHGQSVADALPARVAAHDSARTLQQQIDALRGTGPSQAQRINDQALASALATARDQLERAESEHSQLTARLDAQRQTQAGLVPLLEHMLDLLEQSIRADLPIHTQARLASVAAARRALNNATLSATERFEAVLGIYTRELRLNYTTERSAGLLQTASGPRAVNLLRVGRVALYALADDLAYCAVYRLNDRAWQVLAPGVCRQLDALGERLEQAPIDGLPLSVATAP